MAHHKEVQGLIRFADGQHCIHDDVCQLICKFLIELCAQGRARDTAQNLPVVCIYPLLEFLQEFQGRLLCMFIPLEVGRGESVPR